MTPSSGAIVSRRRAGILPSFGGDFERSKPHRAVRRWGREPQVPFWEVRLALRFVAVRRCHLAKPSLPATIGDGSIHRGRHAHGRNMSIPSTQGRRFNPINEAASALSTPQSSNCSVIAQLPSQRFPYNIKTMGDRGVRKNRDIPPPSTHTRQQNLQDYPRLHTPNPP
ncbi:MAG: hypothetical protein KatS3mg017_0543 [Fimbriimonadales bacterium]|nr:MAG: hypothetical protein KatS3mg017_0543 [Fimbriimonadales bacterium]